MPWYDYRCEECGEVHEMQHGYHDKAPRCPDCHSRMKKLPPGRMAFILKGDCWTRDNFQNIRKPKGGDR